MSNVSIEPGAEIYNGCFSLRFAPKPEEKYVPRNYDEECICNGLRLLSEGKSEEGLRYLLIAWENGDLWAGELWSETQRPLGEVLVRKVCSARMRFCHGQSCQSALTRAEEGGFPVQEKLNEKQ